MKKLLTLFLALSISAVNLSARDTEPVKSVAVDSILYSTTFHFEKNQGSWIESEDYVKAGRLLDWAEANESAMIDIKGWTDKSGAGKFNATLSFRRARTIRNYLVQKGIAAERITFEGKGVDSEATDDAKARRADVVAYACVMIEDARAAEPTEDIDTAMQVEPEVTPAVPNDDVDSEMQVEPEVTPAVPNDNVDSEMQVEPENVSEVDDKSFDWNHFSLRTNLLYWAGGMMNIGAEYKDPDSDFGFVLNGGYSPFGSTKWDHNFGGWFVAPEVRYYFPCNDHWFVGVQALAGGFNFKFSETGRQGDVIGGGVLGGYKLTLNDSFDMDFTLGAGYGRLKYDIYRHHEPTNTNPYIFKGASKKTIIPVQAGVNLIWKIK